MGKAKKRVKSSQAPRALRVFKIEPPVSEGSIVTKDGRIWVQDVTPGKAADFLDKLHGGQRNIRDDRVKTLLRAINAGKFKWIGDSIKFDKAGYLVDGQHRLQAIMQSGITVPGMLCVTLNDDEAAKYIDTTSAPRTIRDLRSFYGQMMIEATVVTAIVYEFCDFKKEDMRIYSKPDRSELVDSCKQLKEAMELQRVGRAKVGLTAGPLAGAIACMKRNKSDAYSFFSAAFANEHQVDELDCPQAKVLANWLIRDHMYRSKSFSDRGGKRADHFEGAYKAIRSWNAYRTDEPLTKLQTPRGEEVMPEPEK